MSPLSNRLEIKHFRLIEAIAREGNLSAAAKWLNLTQPALSHQLKNLESHCGRALFHRHGKKMVITASGHRLLEASHAILADIRALSMDMERLANGLDGQLRISTECYTCYHWLPRVLPAYRKAFPEVSLDIRSNMSDRLLEELEQGKLDLAITMSPANSKFSSFPLFEDDLVVFVPKEHPLAKEAELSAEHLSEETLILYPNGKERLLKLLFRDADCQPASIIEMPLTEAIFEWCAAGLGVSVLARWAGKRYVDSGELVAVPLDLPWTKRTWNAVTLKQELPRHMAQFIELVRKHPPSI